MPGAAEPGSFCTKGHCSSTELLSFPKSIQILLYWISMLFNSGKSSDFILQIQWAIQIQQGRVMAQWWSICLPCMQKDPVKFSASSGRAGKRLLSVAWERATARHYRLYWAKMTNNQTQCKADVYIPASIMTIALCSCRLLFISIIYIWFNCYNI